MSGDRDPKTGQFLTGHKGGPGRPEGSRSRLGEAFLTALEADWKEHGAKAIQDVRTDRPHEYLKVVASILPKDINLKIDPLDEMTDADLDRAIRQIAALVGLEIGAHAPVAGEGEADDAGSSRH